MGHIKYNETNNFQDEECGNKDMKNSEVSSGSPGRRTGEYGAAKRNGQIRQHDNLIKGVKTLV